jgi:ABC-type microcin C transport system permease subunit YejE
VEYIWYKAALWTGLTLTPSLISVCLGLLVALIEILVGIIACNFIGFHATTVWLIFLAIWGTRALTFLAGAAINPVSLNENFKTSLINGSLFF